MGRVLYCREEVKLIDTIRRAGLPVVLGGSVLLAWGLAMAQSPALPATPPTAAQPSAVVPAQPTAHRAQVVYAQGQLEITADNSSLNQILRDVARQTGMKITGGVADQRVYGKYGPGAPGVILASLLEGTGSNMVLRENPAHAPTELVLTSRDGSPTPPSPTAAGGDDDAPAVDVTQQQPAAPSQQTLAPQTPSAPVTPPVSGFMSAPAVTPATGAVAAPSAVPPSTNAGNPQSPNGVRTPQQIFQQLQQMQQQQQPKSK